MTVDAPVEREDTAVLVPEVEGDAWPARTRRGSLRLRLPTAILLTLLLIALGVWGGALLQKHYGSESNTASASPFAAASQAGGAGGFPGSVAAASAAPAVPERIQDRARPAR